VAVPLPQRFFARDVVAVARDLVGARVVRRFDDGQTVVLRLTEVEAYGDASDSASHARVGSTERNSPMFGPPGRAYVYLCYGIHHMLNVSTDDRGRASAVLIRAAEVVRGQDRIAELRGGRRGPDALAGPGKVGQALQLDVSFSHCRLYRRGVLFLASPQHQARVVAGPRVGIEYASTKHRKLRWRFADASSDAVTHRRGLGR
jgi:DNA-3-methyladenine glycosylase